VKRHNAAASDAASHRLHPLHVALQHRERRLELHDVRLSVKQLRVVVASQRALHTQASTWVSQRLDAASDANTRLHLLVRRRCA
jgi:hypothetical protein